MNKLQLQVITSLISLTIASACSLDEGANGPSEGPNATLESDRYNVAFLIMDGVYNTELTAPFDIFHHTRYREKIKAMNVFLVADKHEPVISFEGIRLIPDFNYLTDTLPAIDILVVPSAEHHLDSDLENEPMLSFVRETAQKAEWVTSHCDGAFVLAKTGILDDVTSTTFPSDIEAYRQMFPHLEVADSVLFVHDGKFITSAGGAKSFEAALYLSEVLYGRGNSQTARQGARDRLGSFRGSTPCGGVMISNRDQRICLRASAGNPSFPVMRPKRLSSGL